MAIRTNWYTMDNKLGVTLYAAPLAVVSSVNTSAAPNPDVPAAPMNIGDRVQGNAGSEWMYVQASATVTANNLIAIDINGKVESLTSTHILSGTYAYGIATFAATQANANDFFFACLKAANGVGINAATTVSVAAGSTLYISATEPGRVSGAVVASGRLNGINFAVSATGNTKEAVMFGYIMPQAEIYASTTA